MIETRQDDLSAMERPELTLAARVRAFVAERDHVSFVELEGHMASVMDARGELALEILPNVIVWSGMSAPLAELVRDLLNRHEIHAHPASALVYFVDGKALTLPLAKRLPRGGYTTPHWLPVVLRIVPHSVKKSDRVRLAREAESSKAHREDLCYPSTQRVTPCF